MKQSKWQQANTPFLKQNEELHNEITLLKQKNKLLKEVLIDTLSTGKSYIETFKSYGTNPIANQKQAYNRFVESITSLENKVKKS